MEILMIAVITGLGLHFGMRAIWHGYGLPRMLSAKFQRNQVNTEGQDSEKS